MYHTTTHVTHVRSLLLEIEVGMPRQNAYHNHLHVADVAYTTHLMLEYAPPR